MFDKDSFMNKNFEPRTEDVPVPSLKKFFKKDKKPVFKIRGLSGNEAAKVREAPALAKKRQALMQAAIDSGANEIAEKLREGLGLDEKTPDDVRVRIAQLTLGSVEPKVDEATAVKLNKAFPGVFCLLTNRIGELTGMGYLPGKPKPSGKKKK